MNGLQHGALTHTEQKAIKGPKITSVKPFKRENKRSNLYQNDDREVPSFKTSHLNFNVFNLHNICNSLRNNKNPP